MVTPLPPILLESVTLEKLFAGSCLSYLTSSFRSFRIHCRSTQRRNSKERMLSEILEEEEVAAQSDMEIWGVLEPSGHVYMAA